MCPQLSPSNFSPVRLSPLRRDWGWLGRWFKVLWGVAGGLENSILRLGRLAWLVLAVGLWLASLGLWGRLGSNGPAMAAARLGQTTVSTTTITIPTHAYQPALVQGFNSTYNMPYFRLNRDLYDPGRVENRTYTLIVLENAYLKLTILPELGGRIYQAIYKPTGNNIFYQNPVLKPSPWGPPEMGWWLAAGGMEWGLPVEEHGYEWGVPWQYAINEVNDPQTGAGGVRVDVWDSNASDRLRAKVSITLLDGQALFHVAPTIENPTAAPINYKFWLNAMLAPGPTNKPGENLRFILPAEQVTVHSSGDARLPGPWDAISWPIYNGVDWSRLGNWREWFGFFQRPQAAGDFQAVYDERYDEGVVRAYPSDVAQGAKFFAFGWGPNALPPDLYTDGDSGYVEMHGGVGPTFADTRRLEPGQKITWEEQWYPVAGLGGLTWANAEVALHLESAPEGTVLHVGPSSPRNDVRIYLMRRSDNLILWEETVAQVLPGQPHQTPPIDTGGLAASGLAVVVYAGDTLLGAYQYEGELPPPPTGTPVPSPVPTPTVAPTWSGRVLQQVPVGGWSSVARIWVRGQYGLPVTIRSADGSWSTTNRVGTKPEYGADALEFAPLGPGRYIVEPQGLGVQVAVDLAPGSIAEILFERTSQPTATPVPSPTAVPTPTPTATGAPPSTTPPTVSPTPVPTSTPSTGWIGRELDPIVVSGWSSVVRVWVRGQVGLPVTIAAADDGWSATNVVGSKAEYGPDALEFAPLRPGRYTITPRGLGVSVTIDLASGRIAQVLFERSGPGTPVPTATPTPSPTSTPEPGAWRVRIPTRTTTPGAWFGVVRVSVQGQVGTLVRIAAADGGWSITNRTGTKPEYGPTFLEFAPLGAGTYVITAEGVPVSARLELEQGGLAVVLFER